MTGVSSAQFSNWILSSLDLDSGVSWLAAEKLSVQQISASLRVHSKLLYFINP